MQRAPRPGPGLSCTSLLLKSTASTTRPEAAARSRCSTRTGRRTCRRLSAVLAQRAGDLWILNQDASLPRDSGDPQAVMRQVIPAQPGTDAPPLLAARCRNTWHLHHLAAGTRFDALMAAAAGYTDGGRSIARLLPYLAPLDPADAARMFRDAAPLT